MSCHAPSRKPLTTERISHVFTVLSGSLYGIEFQGHSKPWTINNRAAVFVALTLSICVLFKLYTLWSAQKARVWARDKVSLVVVQLFNKAWRYLESCLHLPLMVNLGRWQCFANSSIYKHKCLSETRRYNSPCQIGVTLHRQPICFRCPFRLIWYIRQGQHQIFSVSKYYLFLNCLCNHL